MIIFRDCLVIRVYLVCYLTEISRHVGGVPEAVLNSTIARSIIPTCLKHSQYRVNVIDFRSVL